LQSQINCNEYFIAKVSKWYELVVFTASMEIYGTAVADKLDTREAILRRRYYRQHCTLEFGSYTKDLSAICPDLSSVFILDNSPGAYRAYPGNVPVPLSKKITLARKGFAPNLGKSIIVRNNFFFRQRNSNQKLV
jgi:Dullard-like phosphatase family protein